MTNGTCYFINKAAAVKYFHAQEGHHAAAVVKQKLAEGLIKIGKPKLKPGQELAVIPEEGRYVCLNK